MRYANIPITLLAIIAGMTFVHAQDSETNKSKPNVTPADATISVANFNTKPVIGYLGHPLGTIVRVTGRVVDGKTTRAKLDMDKMLLEIQTVNGKKTKTKIVFRYPRYSTSLPEPAPGDTFDYYVHESGYFGGVVDPPEELGIDSPMAAHAGFGYRGDLTIHKSLK